MGQDSKYRKFSKEFRESALRRLALTPNVTQLCRELGISRQLLYLWREGSSESNRSNRWAPSSACARKMPSSGKRW